LNVLFTVGDLTEADADVDESGDGGGGGDGDIDDCLSEFNFFSMALIFASVLYYKTVNS
jgi:hypothetical protein